MAQVLEILGRREEISTSSIREIISKSLISMKITNTLYVNLIIKQVICM